MKLHYVHVLKIEKLYESEGIPFEHIDYKDNQDVLDLLEKKPHGILVLLDDEVAVPKGSDKSFINNDDFKFLYKIYTFLVLSLGRSFRYSFSLQRY